MSDDLEQLVRSTLHERAAEVDSGPQWAAASRATRRWPVVTVAAAAVVLIAGAGAVWRAERSTRDLAGGRYPATCAAALPPAWLKALNARPISVDGSPAEVDGVTSDGSAIAQTLRGRYAEQLLLVSPTGAVTPLYSLPEGGSGLETDVGGSSVVLSISASRKVDATTNFISGVTSIVAINTRTHHISRLLHTAPTALRPSARDARSARNQVGNAVVQGQWVYWTVPKGKPSAAKGVVVGYDFATHHYRRVGTYHHGGGVTRDARGVWWPGGSIAASHVPSGVAPLHPETTFRRVFQHSVDTDGKDFAWAQTAERIVHWAGPDSRSAGFEVEQMDSDDDPGFQPIVGVAGHVVLMFTTDQSATYHLLDTRTGALADTDIGPGGSAFAVGSTLYLTRPLSGAGQGTVVIDTAKLPELHC